MKKDVVYTMRMSRRVRDSLKLAARKERRTVASLLDKIISDYLDATGFLKDPTFVGEKRKFARKKVPLPAKTLLREGAEVIALASVILDISTGGVLVTHPKGAQIGFVSIGELPQFEISFEPPRAGRELCLKCDGRHMHDTGNEIQIGAAFTDPSKDDLATLKTYLMQ
jgi:hypothetical protein